MKYLDEVMVINDKKAYSDYKVKKGMTGVIVNPEIRFDEFYVIFTGKDGNDIADIGIKIEDLKLIKDNNITDEDILEDLPKHDPSWWCKVEDGYILNLKGERKNKIPYDYNS